ncbi:MAG: hypothetical protein PF961_01700 [Planctomycetota bacterium]|nr:hypothetical protein [Planctomycetota bacterium]
MTRSGFALFEVAVALLLVAIGVLALAMFLPQAARAQERARFQVYAAAQAVDMVSNFANYPRFHLGMNAEAPEPWDSQVGYSSMAPDLERRLASPRHGIAPVPAAIARRFDSDNDEIRRVLDAGGYLYYSQPLAAVGIKMESGHNPKPPSDASRLVFAVVGAAQANALPMLPWRATPYYHAYPSPPGFVRISNSILAMQNAWETQAWADDTDINKVWNVDLGAADGDRVPNDWKYRRGSSGIWPYIAPRSIADDSSAPDGRYKWHRSVNAIAICLWYAYESAGVPMDFLVGADAPDPADLKAAAADPRQVMAMRLLAYMGMAATSWFPLEVTPDSEDAPSHPGLAAGIAIPGPTPLNPASPGGVAYLNNGTVVPPDFASLIGPVRSVVPAVDPIEQDLLLEPLDDFGYLPAVVPPGTTDRHFRLSMQRIARWHEISLRLIMDHSARFPYDGSLPRPLNRQLATDHPLYMWDLIERTGANANPLSGEITGTRGDIAIDYANIDASIKTGDGQAIAARQWRPVGAQPPSFVGAVTRGAVTTLERVRGLGPNANLERAHDDAWYQSTWGDQAHYSLSARFRAAERCRQLVFWTVDWHSYEDWETEPSAPLDASRYPLRSPDRYIQGKAIYFVTSNTHKEGNNTTMNLPGRMSGVGWEDFLQPESRNPEKMATFIIDPTAHARYRATGSYVRDIISIPEVAHDFSQQDLYSAVGTMYYYSTGHYGRPADEGYSPRSDPLQDGTPVSDPKAVFNGIFGADRNMNARLDRGDLPASVRLHAVEVARFPYYDPRLTLSLR